MGSALFKKLYTGEMQVNFAYISCKSYNVRNGGSKLL